MCTNTEGSFTCGCNDGYLLDSDGTTCNGTYWEIFSLFVILLAFHSLKYVILQDIKNQGDFVPLLFFKLLLLQQYSNTTSHGLP